MNLLEDTGRNAMLDAYGTLLDGGDIQFQTSADVALATCAFSATAFGAAASGTVTAAAITNDSSPTAGTIAHAKLRDSSGTELAKVTVAVSGSDIDLADLVVISGNTVSVSAFSLTLPVS